MKEIKIKDLIKICHGKLISGDENIIINNISKDTRSILNGDIYFGINGDNFDGNLFFKDAFSKGANACVLDNSSLDFTDHRNKTIVIVPDTIKCLQTLASYKRDLYNIPVIAVTGSVGKTSTKDLIYNVLSTQYKVLKTEGNLNNHIGLPLTILKLQNEEIMVVEMGMNNLGEISLLSKIAKPNVGVITNVGTAHIGILKSRKNILKAKLEILDGMNDKSKLIINNDNDLLHEYGLNNSAITVGIKEKSFYQAVNIKNNNSAFDIKSFINDVPNSFCSEAYLINSLLSYAIAKEFNISNDNFVKGLENFKSSGKRLELVSNDKGIMLINDSYNANYDSMKVALEYLKNSLGKRKIAVLGDMLELGEYASEMHQKVGLEVIKNKIDILVTVGNLAKEMNNTALNNGFIKPNSYHFDTNEDCIRFLKGFIQKEDTIIFKASQRMNFNEIIEELKKS